MTEKSLDWLGRLGDVFDVLNNFFCSREIHVNYIVYWEGKNRWFFLLVFFILCFIEFSHYGTNPSKFPFFPRLILNSFSRCNECDSWLFLWLLCVSWHGGPDQFHMVYTSLLYTHPKAPFRAWEWGWNIMHSTLSKYECILLSSPWQSFCIHPSTLHKSSPSGRT